MRLNIIFVIAMSLIFSACDSSSGGGGGAASIDECSAGANIVPKTLTALTADQKDRVKSVVLSFKTANILAFENKLVKKNNPKVKKTAAYNKQRLNKLEGLLNDEDCEVSVGTSEVSIDDSDGGKCPIHATRNEVVEVDTESDEASVTTTKSVEFKIMREASKKALDVVSFKVSEQLKSSAEKAFENDNAPDGGFSKNGISLGAGHLNSRSEGKVSVCASSKIENYKVLGKVENPEDKNTELTIEILGGSLTDQTRVEFKDFTLYTEIRSVGKVDEERVEYLVNGETVSEKEFSAFSFSAQRYRPLPDLQPNKTLDLSCFNDKSVMEIDPFKLNPDRGAKDADKLEPSIYKRLVDELNLARTQPKRYARIIEQTLQYYDLKGNYKDPFGGPTIRTSEGTKAVEEAVEALKEQEPVGCLKYSRSLSKPAADHAGDQSKTGAFGHDGSDGSSPGSRGKRHGKYSAFGENISYGPSWARDIVIGLIVDDNVPDRGHRHNIYGADWEKVGLSCKTHKKLRWVCVQNYAKDWIGKRN